MKRTRLQQIFYRYAETFCFAAAALMSPALASADHCQSHCKDADAIRAMKGCYQVDYRFEEKVPLQPGYTLHAPYHVKGLEWVVLDEDSSDKIALQHILILPDNAGFIKHWRQEWSYEPESLIEYRGNQIWKKRPFAGFKNEWVQRVYQVDDSPRYECVAAWVHGEGNSYWECGTWAPLPRRELPRIKEYNVMDRVNRHEITDTGWLQNEDNLKLKVDPNGNLLTVLVREEGVNTYTKVDDSVCAAAQTYWNTNQNLWHEIQSAWKDIYDHESVLKFQVFVDGTMLWQRLFELADEMSRQSYPAGVVKAKAAEIIRAYLIPSTSN